MANERARVMAARLRLLSAVCALVAAVIVVWQANPNGAPDIGPSSYGPRQRR